MFRNKIFLLALLAVAFFSISAYCQENAANRQITAISGTITKVDFVGGFIVVDTGSGQLELSVPDDAVMVGGTEKLGLVDLQESDPVTVQYYNSSSDQHIVVSIVDNNALLE